MSMLSSSEGATWKLNDVNIHILIYSQYIHPRSRVKVGEYYSPFIFDQILKSIIDIQVPIPVEIAQVASPQPSIWGYNFAGLLLVVFVSPVFVSYFTQVKYNVQ